MVCGGGEADGRRQFHGIGVKNRQSARQYDLEREKDITLTFCVCANITIFYHYTLNCVPLSLVNFFLSSNFKKNCNQKDKDSTKNS